jgi:hypothetical protein
MDRFQAMQGAGDHDPFPIGLPFGPHAAGIRHVIQLGIKKDPFATCLVMDKRSQRTSQAGHAGRNDVLDERRSDERIEGIAPCCQDLRPGGSCLGIVGCDGGSGHGDQG